MKSKTIEIPIYFDNLVIHQVDQREQMQEIADKNDLEFNSAEFDAFAFLNDRSEDKPREYVMVFCKNVVSSVIAHESKHIVNMIFKDRMISLDLDNDEPECYLLEWIVGQATDFLKDIPKTKIDHFSESGIKKIQACEFLNWIHLNYQPSVEKGKWVDHHASEGQMVGVMKHTAGELYKKFVEQPTTVDKNKTL